MEDTNNIDRSRLYIMKKLSKYSLSSILVYVLAIFIAFFGVKDYQQQRLRINADYDFQLNVANMSMATEMTLIQIEQTQLKLENDPTKKSVIQKELASKIQAVNIEKMTITEKVNKQREEELDGRIFDLLTYFSLSITFFMFGITLSWRKKDALNMEEQQKVILYNLNKKNHDIEQMNENLHAQNAVFSNENQHLKDAYNQQIKFSNILVKKLDEHIKIIEETNKQLATTRQGNDRF